jgi:hypothetical protein
MHLVCSFKPSLVSLQFCQDGKSGFHQHHGCGAAGTLEVCDTCFSVGNPPPHVLDSFYNGCHDAFSRDVMQPTLRWIKGTDHGARGMSSTALSTTTSTKTPRLIDDREEACAFMPIRKRQQARDDIANFSTTT